MGELLSGREAGGAAGRGGAGDPGNCLGVVGERSSGDEGES